MVGLCGLNPARRANCCRRAPHPGPARASAARRSTGSSRPDIPAGPSCDSSVGAGPKSARCRCGAPAIAAAPAARNCPWYREAAAPSSSGSDKAPAVRPAPWRPAARWSQAPGARWYAVRRSTAAGPAPAFRGRRNRSGSAGDGVATRGTSCRRAAPAAATSAAAAARSAAAAAGAAAAAAASTPGRARPATYQRNTRIRVHHAIRRVGHQAGLVAPGRRRIVARATAAARIAGGNGLVGRHRHAAIVGPVVGLRHVHARLRCASSSRAMRNLCRVIRNIRRASSATRAGAHTPERRDCRPGCRLSGPHRRSNRHTGRPRSDMPCLRGPGPTASKRRCTPAPVHGTFERSCFISLARELRRNDPPPFIKTTSTRSVKGRRSAPRRHLVDFSVANDLPRRAKFSDRRHYTAASRPTPATRQCRPTRARPRRAVRKSSIRTPGVPPKR